ncbi:MAG: ATP-binding cassette domain-containing protein [Candidatus Zeuxoniibacter abyssi]|nr:MAG: ATP-binding cassette domain-containing protein [Candidatus Persebacteraceae bacterium AB1(2)]
MRDGAQRDDAPILSCSHLTMRFGGLLAVSDLSFSVRAGDIHGLIGPNGAGKTTIFNVMSGFYKPTSGGVMYRGKHRRTQNAHHRRQRAGANFPTHFTFS